MGQGWSWNSERPVLDLESETLFGADPAMVLCVS
jgi:hypothetical protein